MNKRNKYRYAHSGRKVKIIRWINIFLVVFMFSVVIFDSFKHDLPFYYALFFIGGMILGRIIFLTQKFKVDEVKKTINVETNPLGVLIVLILLSIRFFGGKLILSELHVVWVTDALYLLFMGIYYAKIRNIIRNIDEHVYARFFEPEEFDLVSRKLKNKIEENENSIHRNK